MSERGDNSPFPWELDERGAERTAERAADTAPADMSLLEEADDPASPSTDDAEHAADARFAAADNEEGRAEGGAPAEAISHDTSAGRRADRPLVRKEYYSISEVADMVALPAHVLRYWESQFPVLNPSKNRSGNRVYQRKEIRLILLVKQLLYDEKYTVEGAKQKLEQLRRGGNLTPATTQALDVQLVRVLRDELRALQQLLAPDAV